MVIRWSNERFKVLAAQVETEESLIKAVAVREEEEIDEPEDNSKKAGDAGQGKLIVAEEIQVGSVSWPASKSLFAFMYIDFL